jgi:hypothetical protein
MSDHLIVTGDEVESANFPRPHSEVEGEFHEIPHMDVDDRSVSVRHAGYADLHGRAGQPIARSQTQAQAIQAH